MAFIKGCIGLAFKSWLGTMAVGAGLVVLYLLVTAVVVFIKTFIYKDLY